MPGARGLVVGFYVGFACCCFGLDVHLESAGVRFGFSPIGAGRDFHQAEAFVNWNLPWMWDLGSLWRLQSRVEVSAGWIEDSGVNAGLVAGGPSFSLSRRGSRLSFDCGISPTVLTRSNFPSKDFGIPFEFTSHGGLSFEISSRIRLSYRFQHMSNAGLGPHNPGLNLNMFGISYVF